MVVCLVHMVHERPKVCPFVELQEVDEMAWYAMFVMTGHEHEVADIISNYWRVDGVKPFVPMFDVRFRKAGKVLSETRRWIPGYVFLESELSGLDFYLQVRPHILHTENA